MNIISIKLKKVFFFFFFLSLNIFQYKPFLNYLCTLIFQLSYLCRMLDEVLTLKLVILMCKALEKDGCFEHNRLYVKLQHRLDELWNYG